MRKRQGERSKAAVFLVGTAVLFILACGCGKVVSPGIQTLACSADGKRLYFIEGIAGAGLSSPDYWLFSSNVDRTRKTVILKGLERPQDISPSPDGKYIAVIDFPEIKIVRVSDNSFCKELNSESLMTYGWDTSSRHFWYSSDLTPRAAGMIGRQGEWPPINNSAVFLLDVQTWKTTRLRPGKAFSVSDKRICYTLTSNVSRWDYNELHVSELGTGQTKLSYQTTSGSFAAAVLSRKAVFYALNLKNNGTSEMGKFDLQTGSKEVIWSGRRSTNSMLIVKSITLDEKRNLLIFEHGAYGTSRKGGLSVIDLSDGSVRQLLETEAIQWTYNRATAKVFARALGKGHDDSVSIIPVD